MDAPVSDFLYLLLTLAVFAGLIAAAKLCEKVTADSTRSVRATPGSMPGATPTSAPEATPASAPGATPTSANDSTPDMTGGDRA